jgi:nucleotide-binding universal stress UspA family protein
MLKTILVSTDGSELSDKAINAAIEFAKANENKVIGLSVAEPYPFSPRYQNAAAVDATIYKEKMREMTQLYAQKIADATKEAKIASESNIAQLFSPYEKIIAAARKFNCDVISIAAHGTRRLEPFIHWQ